MKALAIALVALVACGGSQAKDPGTTSGKSKARKLDPINPKAAKEIENAMRALRHSGPDANETARGRLREAVKIDGKMWEAWHDLGVIAWKEGDDDEAINDFGKALGIKKGHVPSLLARAEAHRRAGHKKDARADY